MNFLHYLDVMIGYALAMIVLSTMIGTAAAAWLAIIASKARHLENGLSSMLATISGSGLAQSTALATDILQDPTIKPFGKLEIIAKRWNIPVVSRSLRWLRSCAAETITREELALMILRQASEGCAAAIRALGVSLTPEEAASIKKAQDGLAALGLKKDANSQAERDRLKKELSELPVVERARELLTKVESTMLAEEVADPTQPAQVWRTKALQTHVPLLAARLFHQFDNVMDRVEDNESYSAKVIAAAMSLAFLCWYPVDSMALLTRLSADPAALRVVVEQAAKVGQTPTDVESAQKRLLDLGMFGDFNSGKHIDDANVNKGGVLATWMMVCLGAPFWLKVLNQLLGFKTLMSQKASEERERREQDQNVEPQAAAAAAGGRRG